MAASATERKGLRFEVYLSGGGPMWTWVLVGKGDEAYARAPIAYDTEKECRSAIAGVRGKLKAAGRAKVLTI